MEIKRLKVHALTQYSRLITLPKFWVRQHGLQPQDEVILCIDEHNNLIIKAGKNDTTA
jgi:phosphate uptake regulator